MSTHDDKHQAHMRETFSRHAIRRETGWTWSCRRPGDSAYAFRVSWCPSHLTVTGDIGSIVITHYSFTDPWAAAAWVAGAGWSYFMEKSSVGKAYDAEATAEFIIEHIYGWLRGEDRDTDRARQWLDRIADLPGIYSSEDEHTAAWRKDILRQLTSSGLSESDAYEVTEDAECCLYRYPERERWKYEALRLWAGWMWQHEPVWHKAVLAWRMVRAELRDTRRFIYGPIRYEYVGDDGRPSTLNGCRYWVFRRRGEHAAFLSVTPARLFGRDLSWLGIWRMQGSSWPVNEPSIDRWGSKTRSWQFRDVREVAA